MTNLLKIEREAKKFFSGARGSHAWDHTQRVYRLCLHLGKKEKADLMILKLAAILHDIGRKKQYDSGGKVCHAEVGAKLAERLLTRHQVNQNIIHHVVACIKTHRFRGNQVPQSKEAKILFDADKLDAIGATGIGRAFLFAGEIGSKLHNDKSTDLTKTKEYSKEDTAYREFVLKLSKVKNKMLTRIGKNMAQERHNFMISFFDRLNQEVDGEL